MDTDNALTKRSTWKSSISLVTEKNFGLFFAASTISVLGTNAAQTGLALALFVLGYSAADVGLVLAAGTFPMLVLMLVGGVFGDRWPRRILMIASDLLRFVSQALLAVLLATEHVPILVLMVLAALCGVGNAFYAPAEGGLIPQVSNPKRLEESNSLLSFSGSAAMILGPAIGGLLVGFSGGAAAIGLDALSYLISATLLAFVVVPRGPLQQRPAESFLTELKLGWHEFRKHRWLELMTIQIAVQDALALGVFFVIAPGVYSLIPHGPQYWGFLSGGVGVGGMLGAALALRLRHSRPLYVVQLSLAAMTLPIFMLAFHAPVLIQMFGHCVFGAGMATTNILFATTVQKHIPPGLMSRVNSFVHFAISGLIPLGYICSGPFASLVGPHVAMGVIATLLLVSVLLMCTLKRIISFRYGDENQAVALK